MTLALGTTTPVTRRPQATTGANKIPLDGLPSQTTTAVAVPQARPVGLGEVGATRRAGRKGLLSVGPVRPRTLVPAPDTTTAPDGGGVAVETVHPPALGLAPLVLLQDIGAPETGAEGPRLATPAQDDVHVATDTGVVAPAVGDATGVALARHRADADTRVLVAFPVRRTRETSGLQT